MKQEEKKKRQEAEVEVTELKIVTKRMIRRHSLG